MNRHFTFKHINYVHNFVPAKHSAMLVIFCPTAIASRIGLRLLPRSISKYSTPGGTSSYTFLTTSPFFSISRSWDVSTFCDSFPMDFISWPNRFVPSIRSHRIRLLSRMKADVKRSRSTKPFWIATETEKSVS